VEGDCGAFGERGEVGGRGDGRVYYFWNCICEVFGLLGGAGLVERIASDVIGALQRFDLGSITVVHARFGLFQRKNDRCSQNPHIRQEEEWKYARRSEVSGVARRRRRRFC